MIRFAPLAVALIALSCHSTSPKVMTNLDMNTRNQLLDAVKSLEGTWECKGPDGSAGRTEFHVSSSGSAVREIMFGGTEHEMTNMYHLDGNTLVLTHYCAAGNQPRMCATRKDGNSLVFHFDSVCDLKSPTESYMGQVKIDLIDKDHMTQTWQSTTAGKTEPPMVFAYTRVK
jgi:hypothetical protein